MFFNRRPWYFAVCAPIISTGCRRRLLVWLVLVPNLSSILGTYHQLNGDISLTNSK